MFTGDLTAKRDDLLDLTTSAPALTSAPERLFVAAPGEARLSRFGRILPSISVSVVVHAVLAVAFVILWRSMVRDLSAPEPISVEIVHSIPGEAPPTASPVVKPEPPQPKPDPIAPAPAPPPASSDPLPMPQAPVPQPITPDAAAPMPAPKAVLIEPPPEPKAAATQREPDPKPNAVEEHPVDPAPAAAEPPLSIPAIMTAPGSDTTVAPRSTEPDRPDPSKASETDPLATKDPHAQMAAALPTSTSLAMPSSFRALLSSAGPSESQEYKGAVYGVLGRIRQVGPAAKRLGMSQGQVGLLLTVAATGAIASVQIMQSSGRPEVDAMVVEMVRQAGPFPPPPPGSSRTFTPMISFGEQ